MGCEREQQRMLFQGQQCRHRARRGGGSHHMLCTVDFMERKVKMYDSNRRKHKQDHTERGEEILAFVEAKAKRDKIPFDVEKWTVIDVDGDNCP